VLRLCGSVMEEKKAQYTHLQQQKETERVIDVFYIFNSTVID